VCCAKKVSKLINSPVVRLLGTRVGSTSAEVVPQGVILAHKKNKERLCVYKIESIDHRELTYVSGKSKRKMSGKGIESE
jgi:hypothetical protein